jgi:hypothetical protein
MRVVLLLVVFVLGVADASILSKVFEWRGKLFGYPAWAPSVPAAKRDAPYKVPKASCGAYVREMAVDCFHYLADLNCDHALDRHEVDTGKSNLLTWFERTVAFLAVSTDNIMRDCDTNHDGFISRAEFLNDYEHCLNSEREMCLVRDICWREMQTHVALCTNKK